MDVGEFGMSLLPSRGPDASGSQDGELEIVGVDEDVSAVLDALSSDTAREILNSVYHEPGTPSDLADRLDMSIQKVSYHLDKLEEQELIAVAGTQYSEKGQEMKVFEPPEDPLVLFVGTSDRKRSLRSLAERLLPAVGLLTALSAVVQVVFGTAPSLFQSASSDGAAESEPAPTSGDDDMMDSSEGGGGGTEESAETPTDDGGGTAEESTEALEEEVSTATEYAREATEVATETAAGGGLDLEPGVAFFLGGLLVLAVVGITWTYTK